MCLSCVCCFCSACHLSAACTGLRHGIAVSSQLYICIPGTAAAEFASAQVCAAAATPLILTMHEPLKSLLSA